MSWVGSRPVHLFLGARRAGLVQEGRSERWIDAESTRQAWDLALDEIPPRSSLRIWLSGGVARPFLLSVQGLRAEDAPTVSASRASEETGLASPCRVVVERWLPDGRLLCVAAEESVIAAIETAAAGKRVHVKTIRPWWAAVGFGDGVSAASVGAVTIEDGDSLVALAGSGDAMEVATALVPAPFPEERQTLLHRLTVLGGGGRQRHARLDIGQVRARAGACPFGASWSDTP